jgi:hypothetical protein
MAMTDDSRLNRRAAALWAVLSAVAVVALFPLLHMIVPHAAGIILAGILGAGIGAIGYRRTSGDPSGVGLSVAGGLGALVGLFVLHLGPLLHR